MPDNTDDLKSVPTMLGINTALGEAGDRIDEVLGMLSEMAERAGKDGRWEHLLILSASMARIELAGRVLAEEIV